MSKHLESIINTKNQICDMQIVFIDIVKYSKRKTVRQVELINRFTKLIKSALTETNKEYFESFSNNNLNLSSDSIIIPTGDGLAIGMPFDWLKTLHLDVAINVLKEIYSLNQENDCTEYIKNGYCDCHNNLSVRIGISIGKVILYKDINDNYNIAGNPINMAARVMNYGMENQIYFTKDAFQQLDDLSIESNTFKEYKDKEIKHGLHIDLYQFINTDFLFLNSNITEAPSDHSNEEIHSGNISELVNLVNIKSGSFFRHFDQTKIEVNTEFAISKFPISQELYEKVMNENPSHFNNPLNPVENITFLQAIKFCNNLSELEGFNKVYTINSEGSISMNKKTKGYRLPFEYEWDYVLNQALQGENISILNPWLSYNSDNQTRSIDKSQVYDIKIVDLIGNVWEWCFDNYISEIKYEKHENNEVVIPNRKTRVIKGGSYSSIQTTIINNNFRTKQMQEKRNKNCGFRIIFQNLN